MTDQNVLADHHLAWLESRGLEPELCSAIGLRSGDPIGSKGRDKGKAIRPGEWIAFPFMLNGVEAAVQYRNVVDKQFLTAGADAKQLPLWNLEAILDPSLAKEPAIITEGMIDAITALQAEFPRTASVPNGSGSDVDKCLSRDVMRALRGATVVLAMDGDIAGNAVAQRIAQKLGAARCKAVRYPSGCKDLNAVLTAHGIQEVARVIAEAPWFPVEGCRKLSEIKQQVSPPAMRLGFGDFDDQFRPRLGDFYVLTGIPSHGKTTLMLQILGALIQRFKLRVAIAPLEQEPTIDLRRDLWTLWAGRPATLLSDEERDQANAWIDQWFEILVPDEDTEPDVDWFLTAAGAAVLRKGCRIVVGDPWNELEHYHPGESTTDYTGHALKRLKRFGRQTRTMMWMVAHPAKLRRLENGRYPNATLWDVADSAHWYNKPDGGLIVRRNLQTGATEVEVAKARYKVIGFPGTVPARFDHDSQRLVFQGEDEFDLKNIA